jgi:hypothetical protein
MTFVSAGKYMDAKTKAFKKDELERFLKSSSDRGKGSVVDHPRKAQLLRLSTYLHSRHSAKGLRERCDMLLCVALLLRCEDTKDLELPYLSTMEFESEGDFFLVIFNY